MDRPNSTANMNNGTKLTIGTFPVSPTTWMRKPFSKTRVTTPKAAPIEMRFIIPAVSGITSERKASISRMKLSAMTTRIVSMRWLEISSARSM